MKWSPKFETYLQETITKYTGILAQPYLNYMTIKQVVQRWSSYSVDKLFTYIWAQVVT